MRPLSLIAIEFLILSSASFVWSRNFHARPRSKAEIEEKWGTWSDSTLSQIGSNSSLELLPRSLPAGQCSSTEQCADLSCCSNTGYCGLDPQHCDLSVCVSNCQAKAPCGAGAAIPGTTCPLNVCCSQWGYCGVTSDFCGTGCQSDCPQPAPTSLGNGDVQSIVIGYWEGWSLTQRGCRKRSLSDVPTDSLTHLNVAFAYMTADTFQLYPMLGTSEEIFMELTNLKQNAPGLQWVSIGGWDFNDNGTDTQHAFGNMAASADTRMRFILNLAKFMTEYGFDGVDFDWEYPGAPDRGGSGADQEDYVSLLQDLNSYIKGNNLDWGVSFTAPTSYWYLRWFDITSMIEYVDWMNLMTYDLHGSWDSPEDDIGSFVYAHTNLTEIEDALKLLWRNAIPANKVNLGIGFYGRSYTLQDPNCIAPGCAFSGPGIAGPCTGTPGVLSYDEITSVIQTNSLDVHYDETAGVKYFEWDNNQWASYDDVDTLKQKVDFANKQGLLGLFIWAIDLDTLNHTALNAVLSPNGLGVFKDRNGVGTFGTSDYGVAAVTECVLGECGAGCPTGQQLANTQAWCVKTDGSDSYYPLCCPINNTPDPADCEWVAGDLSLAKGGVCSGYCPSGQVQIAQSKHAAVGGSDIACFNSGWATYCCNAVESHTCAWADSCIEIGSNGQPSGDSGCPKGRNFVTYSEGNCKPQQTWKPYCCDAAVGTDQCYWQGATGWQNTCDTAHCKNGEALIGQYELGGGADCELYTGSAPNGSPYHSPLPRGLCCNAAALSFTLNLLPIPLADLFPHPGQPTDTQNFAVKLENVQGGDINNADPNESPFGFLIISGPSDELITVDKRDGSHWEIYDCPTKRTEARHTVKAVCTNSGEDSNCWDIRKGFGVSGTVVELPDGCGPGRYAMALSLEPSKIQDKPKHLVKRGLVNETVYDFTFDYDFTPLQKRAATNVLLRVDYSDDPGYWDSIIDTTGDPSTTRKHKRQEIDELHGGDVRRWLHHTWRKERRDTPEHKLHELHARWFSGDVAKWWAKQTAVNVELKLASHTLSPSFRWYLFDSQFFCPAINLLGIFQVYADLNIAVSTSIGLTLIGTLGNLESFAESHVFFRSFGSVDASFVMSALAQLTFTTGQVELFGLENFGANFRIPGIVTIGPNFQVFGEIKGAAELSAEVRVDVNLANWDYTQRYPAVTDSAAAQGTAPPAPAAATGGVSPAIPSPSFSWNVNANGEIQAHVIPKVTLGIVWDSDKVADASIDLKLDAYATFYGEASVSSVSDATICYGVDIGCEIWAEVRAPTLFNIDLSNNYPLWNTKISPIPKTCAAATVPGVTGSPHAKRGLPEFHGELPLVNNVMTRGSDGKLSYA